MRISICSLLTQPGNSPCPLGSETCQNQAHAAFPGAGGLRNTVVLLLRTKRSLYMFPLSMSSGSTRFPLSPAPTPAQCPALEGALTTFVQ